MVAETAVSEGKLRWLPGSREERVERLRGFYEGRGVKGAERLAEQHADKPLANLCGDCTAVLDLMWAGKEPAEIARQMGVKDSALYAYLLEYAPGAWAQISSSRAIARLKEADEQLSVATDNVDVRRAQAIGDLAKWHLERLQPGLYGGKKDGGGGVSITVNLDGTCGGTVVVGQGGVERREIEVRGTEALDG